MAVFRNTQFSQYFKRYIRSSRRLYSTDVMPKGQTETSIQEIVIPYRIPRGPTDILKALASTVKKDYTAAHYKYEDDPYFIPVSNVSKRSFALSKESGKKAARYFLENYPDLFQVHKSEPLIKAFEPPAVYTENDAVSEEILKSCIESYEVTNCITVYNLLKNRGISCSQETLQSLLELLCFYNCEEPPSEEFYEERWFSRPNLKPQNIWKQNGPAENLFQEMSKDNAAPYCAMIQGCAKHFHVERALSLYEELCSKNFTGTIETYNSLLAIAPFVKQDGDMRWEFAMHIVRAMNDSSLTPNLRTMNALFNIASRSKRWKKARSITMQILAEMRRLNIEPSLGSYYHVLVVFCYNSVGYSGVLSQIINQISGKAFSIRHPDDVMFFITAMEICNTVVGDKDLAYRIHDLLETSNNCSLMGSAISESVYFRHYFGILCAKEDFDKFMKTYEKYVPHSYTPEPSVMLDIIIALDFSAAYHHLPKICSDVSLFEQTERENVLEELLKVIASVKHPEKEQDQLITMVWSIIEKIEKRAEVKMRHSLQWTGAMLGYAIKTFLNGNDLEKAWHIMQKLDSDKETISGYPDESVFTQLCSAFITEKDYTKMEFCLKFATNCGFSNVKLELSEIASEMVKKQELDENECILIRKILDIDLLEDKQVEHELSESKTSEN